MKRIAIMFCPALVALTLVGTALAQSTIPPDQLANFNQYLANHPEVGEFLLSNNSSNQYQNFLQNNSGFQQYLNGNPNLRDQLNAHPQWFQQGQQRFFQSRGFTPGQVSALTGFLGKHPWIAKDFDNNSNLAFNQGYLNAHPDLRKFLNAHPGIVYRLRQNPWMLSRNRRLAQPNWWNLQQRAYNQGYGAGVRNAEGQEAAEEESEQRDSAERRDSAEHEDFHSHHDHGRHLGWGKHHGHHDDGDDQGQDEDRGYGRHANWNRGDHDYGRKDRDGDRD